MAFEGRAEGGQLMDGYMGLDGLSTSAQHAEGADPGEVAFNARS